MKSITDRQSMTRNGADKSAPYLCRIKKQPDYCPAAWRGLRDLNSRAGFPTYSLSRGAPSPLG